MLIHLHGEHAAFLPVLIGLIAFLWIAATPAPVKTDNRVPGDWKS